MSIIFSFFESFKYVKCNIVNNDWPNAPTFDQSRRMIVVVSTPENIKTQPIIRLSAWLSLRQNVVILADTR